MKKIIILFFSILFAVNTNAQTPTVATSPAPSAIMTRFNKEGLKVYLSPDSTQWLKATMVMQNQVRYNDNNPNSNVFGSYQRNSLDVGIRRLRFQVFGQVAKRVFVYAQFGMNNFNSLTQRKQGAFFHDIVAEYSIYKKYVVFGTGLNSSGGPLRFSSPAVGSIMMADAPIYQQTTTDQSDQFSRKLGVYFKGQVGRFDYRLGAGKPFPVQTMVNPNGAALVPTTGTAFDTSYATNAKFSPAIPHIQYQGYFKWQFFDKEANDVPYNPGTYNGKKRVLTLGAGFQYQQNAMRYWDSAAVPSVVNTYERSTYLKSHDLMIIGADVFYDSYINQEKGTAISIYAAFSYADYGHNYLRYNGVMNMATGTTNPLLNAKAYGNAFPMFGTGNTEFAQIGYKFRNNLLGDRGTLQPYIGVQVSQYQAFNKKNMVMSDIGVNWLISGYNKLSLNFQSRPVYELQPNKSYKDIESARRGMLYLQYQISF